MNNAGTWSVTPGVTYTYSFDAMGRPIKLTDNDASRAVDWVKDLVYDPTGVNTQMRYLAAKGATLAQDVYYQETKTFNNLLQMTRLTTTNQSTSTTVMDMEYHFSATQNNGRITQQGNTRDMVFGIPALIAYLSSFMTLAPGDVILTGTPEGVVDVKPGDEVITEIEGVGRLINNIVDDAGYFEGIATPPGALGNPT